MSNLITLNMDRKPHKVILRFQSSLLLLHTIIGAGRTPHHDSSPHIASIPGYLALPHCDVGAKRPLFQTHRTVFESAAVQLSADPPLQTFWRERDTSYITALECPAYGEPWTVQTEKEILHRENRQCQRERGGARSRAFLSRGSCSPRHRRASPG